MKVSQLAPLIGLVLFVPQVSDAADDVLVWYKGYSDQSKVLRPNKSFDTDAQVPCASRTRAGQLRR